MQGKYKVITLCGSTRFKEEFLQAQKELTLQGNIVISVGLFGHSGDDEVWLEDTKEMLDDMHKSKIDMADEIFVINPDGYIGSSTQSEILYAKKKRKGIRYLCPKVLMLERSSRCIVTKIFRNEEDGMFRFVVDKDESALRYFLSDEEAEGREFYSSNSFDTLKAALESLPSYNFEEEPCFVHPDAIKAWNRQIDALIKHSRLGSDYRKLNHNEELEASEEFQRILPDLNREVNIAVVEEVIRILEEVNSDDVIDRIAELKALLAEDPQKAADSICGFGSCHSFWKWQKIILKKKYGMVWYTPNQTNPGVCFD